MLVLGRAAYEGVLAHAREVAPEEACGLLAGSTEPHATVSRIARATNAAATPEYTYEIDPEEQFRLMETLEEEGFDVVGIYHSHPRGPDGPSTTDRARATWEGYHYLIVSLGGEVPVVDAWVWTGEQFRRSPVRVEDRPPD